MPTIDRPDCLLVGDYITLRNVKFDCLLAGEGILLEDLIITDSLQNIDEAVFCVHLQRQYSASIELDEFMLSYDQKVRANNSNPLLTPLPVNITDCEDPQTLKYLHALKRCLYNENVLNESYMKQKSGMPVMFGDIVQLFHVKSQKYLTITNDQLAKDERENMRVELNSKGSPFSWVQLSPRYKIDKDGDKILTKTELYLRVAERANEFVHCSERELMPKIMDPRMNPKGTSAIAMNGTGTGMGTGMTSSAAGNALPLPITPGMESVALLLTSAEEAGVDLSPDRPKVREVNCSLENSSWQMIIYQSSLDRADKYMLLSSQIVTIQDPETKSLLTIGFKKTESLDDDDGIDPRQRSSSRPNTGAGTGTGTRGNTNINAGVMTRTTTIVEGPAEHFHEFGDLILVPQTSGHVSSSCYWIMENTQQSGSPVAWKTQHVRFRHVNTNVFLMLEIVEMLNDLGELEEKYLYTTTTESAVEGTMFSLHEMYAARTQLGNMKPLQISHDGVYMTRGSVMDAGSDDKVQLCYILKGSQEKDLALSLIFSRFSGGVDEEGEESTEDADKKAGGAAATEQYDVSNTIREPMDVHVGIAARDYVQNFLNITTIPTNDTVATIWPGADSEDMDFFVMLMQKINWFIQGFPISSTNINPDVDKADPKVRTQRQYQLQEQKILELILRIINKLIPISEQAGIIANLLKQNRQVSEDKINCNRMGQAVLKLCFDIIYSAIQDHPSNQMHIADFLPVLLAHLSVQPLAGKCVTEMLNKNMELQETKIGKREITIFINQLKEARMNAMYLGLLQSCCSCQGEGVDGNQRLIAQMLFDGEAEMMIKVIADFSRLQQIDWNVKEGNLYVPLQHIAGSPVMGENLFMKGLPTLSLTWTTNAIDYSPLGLFGKLTVPIEELYRRNGISSGNMGAAAPAKGRANKNSKLLAKKAISLEAKKSVADYFIAEMYLGAEMLMDRNYISLQKLAPLFSFDILMTLLKMDVDDNLKAAAMRLLMYLYIDTDPQLESTIPCLTRPWSEIAMNDTPKLPYVEPVRRHMFGLIQHVLSEHIAGLRGTRWTRLSLSMFEVLRMLVSFNFYGTMDRMKDIIEPLILALDRRKIDYSKDSMVTAQKENREGALPGAATAGGASTSSRPGTADLNAANVTTTNFQPTASKMTGGGGFASPTGSMPNSPPGSPPMSANPGAGSRLASPVPGATPLLASRSVSGGAYLALPGGGEASDTDLEGGSGGVGPLEIAFNQEDEAQGGGDIFKRTWSSMGNSLAMTAGTFGRTYDAFASWDLYRPMKRVKDVVDCFPVMIFILILVIIAVAATIYETVTGKTSFLLNLVQYIILGVFIVEVGSRFIVYRYLYGSTKKFFKSVYNNIDVLVIAVDVLFLGLPSNSGGAGKYARILRLIRLVRLVRLARAARVISVLVEVVEISKEKLISASRYTKSPIFELDAMVQAIEILLLCQANIEDRNVSLLLRYFYKWECGDEKRTPVELFNVVMEEANEMALHSNESDDVFIDLIMFVHPPLVQRVLDVLMAHYTRRRVLLAHAGNVQLLVSARRERQYKLIDQMLFQLDLNVETQELWGDLETDSHHATNKQTIDMLTELIDVCCIKRSFIDTDEIGQVCNPDLEIQNLLRNLGCLSTCLKVVKLLEGVELEEDEDGEVASSADLTPGAKNVIVLVSLANKLLYWFFLNNKANQELGYAKLDAFVDILDQNVGAHHVVYAIFRGNEKLMKLVPHSYVDQMIENICKDGRNSVYLTLLHSITNVGEKNFPDNQYDIAKQITDAAKQDSLNSYLVNIQTPKYKEKVELMKPFLGKKNVAIETLPMELQYHIAYLQVVASCTVGSMNTTIVEAKIQAAFNHVDIVEAMLDHECILIVRLYLGLFYFNGIIDVAMEIPGLEHTACIWKLLKTFPFVLEQTHHELDNAERFGGIQVDEVDRQMIEYCVVCVRILTVFFEKYYDPMMFAMMEDREDDDTGKFVVMTSAEADTLFNRLFDAMKKLYKQDSSCISRGYKAMLVKGMQTMADFTVAIPTTAMVGIGPKSAPQLTKQVSTLLVNDADTLLEIELEETHEIKDADHMLERRIQRRYDEFLSVITNSEEIKEQQDKESLPFINVIESLPYLKDKHIVGDVRYESFIRKLVAHTRSKIEVKIGVEKRLDAQCTLTSIWIMQAFRTTIENKWGMDVFQRDDDGGEEEDILAADLMEAFNHCGAVTLVLDLIAIGIDPDLQTHSAFLGVAVLLKEGGNQPVQETIYNHLVSSDSELFFRQVRSTIQKLILWHVWRNTEEEAAEAETAEAKATEGAGGNSEAVVVAVGGGDNKTDAEDDAEAGEEEEEEIELPPEIIMLRFLQLFAEGHYKPNQDIMRHQPMNHTSINLLDDFVEYFKQLSMIPCATSTKAAITVTNVILEIIQGPCEKNQEYFALNTELIETLNRVLRSKVIKDCNEEDEIELKTICIDIFQGLLEGQSLKGAVYERVFSVIHFDVVQTLSKSTKVLEEEALQAMDELPDEDAPPLPPIEISEEEAVLKTECTVLLEMLCNYKPSLRRELGMVDENGEATEDHDDTGCIEVVWLGEVRRKFFHIPPICAHLASSSRDNFVFSVDRSNAENQLLDFIERGRVMYMEVKHQEVLIEMGLDKVFNRTNQEYATWIAFFLCCLINLLFLINYTLTNERVPVLSASATTAINVLNIMQLLVATFTFVMFLVVRAPVKYQVNEAEGLSPLDNLFHTATDFMTMYYFGYVIVALLGLVHHDFWSTFLLLDLLMKNATARDVVKAVYNPIRALTMSVLLLVLVVYAYTNVVFFVYRTDLASASDHCYTLWDCFKSLFDIGLRHAHFITDVMYTTYGTRSFLDWFGFIGIKTLLMNLVFGIIIESFKQLREENDEKVDKINNSCFICGIDKETFDRASDGVDGFKRHIKRDHMLWNYWYFFVFIWEQDKDDDDGLELYIRACMERYDVCWFPIGKALVLSDKINEDEALNMELADSVRASTRSLNAKVKDYQHEVGQVMEALASTLKNDSIAGGGQVVKKISRQMQLLTGVGLMEQVLDYGGGADSNQLDSGTMTPVAPGQFPLSAAAGGFDLPSNKSSSTGVNEDDKILEIVRVQLSFIEVHSSKIPVHLRARYDADPVAFLNHIRVLVVSDLGIFAVGPKSVELAHASTESENSTPNVIYLTPLPIMVGECEQNQLHSKYCNIKIGYYPPVDEPIAGVALPTPVGLGAHKGEGHDIPFGQIEIPLDELYHGANTSMDFYFDPIVANDNTPKSKSVQNHTFVVHRTTQYNRSFINLLVLSEEINLSAVRDDASCEGGLAVIDTSDVIESDSEFIAAFADQQ